MKITSFWADERLKDVKLTFDQYALVIQTIGRWAYLVHQDETSAGHGTGYFKSVPTETREAVRQQMSIDIAHSGLLNRMLTGGNVSEDDPREKSPL